MRKGHVLGILMVLAIAVLATPVWAIPIGTVGSIDSLIASAKLGNSGDATELAWVQSILGPSITLDAKYPFDPSINPWIAVDGQPGVYAHAIYTTPEYFMIKTGNVTTGDVYRNFLFRNLAELTYAVIDLGDLDFRNITNVSGISHLDEFGGSQQVPEPGTMILLGSGLIGLAGFGRMMFRF